MASGALDMALPAVEEQLVSGWFEAERSADRSYRWAAGHAAAVVRLAESASRARVSYCLPPGPIGGLKISVCPLEQPQAVWSTRITWLDADWHDGSFPLRLAAGDYVVYFDAEATWSNPGAGRPRILGREPLPWLRSVRALVREGNGVGGFAAMKLSSNSLGEAVDLDPRRSASLTHFDSTQRYAA